MPGCIKPVHKGVGCTDHCGKPILAAQPQPPPTTPTPSTSSTSGGGSGASGSGGGNSKCVKSIFGGASSGGGSSGGGSSKIAKSTFGGAGGSNGGSSKIAKSTFDGGGGGGGGSSKITKSTFGGGGGGGGSGSGSAGKGKGKKRASYFLDDSDDEDDDSMGSIGSAGINIRATAAAAKRPHGKSRRVSVPPAADEDSDDDVIIISPPTTPIISRSSSGGSGGGGGGGGGSGGGGDEGGNTASRAAVWECEVDGEWVPYGADITAQREKACRDRERSVPYERKGTRYVINLIIMCQALDSPDSQHGLLVRRLESSNVEVEALLRTIRERMLESEADTARREQQQRELAVAIAQARAEAQRERQGGAAELVWRAPQQTITVGAVQGTRRSVTRADIKDSRVTRDIEQFHAASGHFWELMNRPGAAKNMAHLGLGNVMLITVTRVDVYESAATREAYDKMRAQLADDRRDTQAVPVSGAPRQAFVSLTIIIRWFVCFFSLSWSVNF
ncbi:hypothetical protein JKP88DRAFT_285823 [Tribonema minus]|uniref:WWE domain-containing protein n=1 Tax=Tribonema minus TaxID=303371 RepID=A0A836CMH6_9STRA|nr:hypothetical protein JKP88DRAFT_285823 [Tribonema minus]